MATVVGTLATAAPNPQHSLDGVEARTARFDRFRLQSGERLPLRIVYETYGKLDPSGRNAILVTHGYTGHHHAAGFYRPGYAPRGIDEREPGWLDGLIGPGKPLDTNRFFVIASNTLGSSYGTTSPASINPRTNRQYGSDFPQITIVDMVAAQRALLRTLGVTHLVAVVGWSYGGYQAFQWSVTYPGMMDGIVVAASAPKGPGNPRGVAQLFAELAQDPNWNDGRYYNHPEGIRTTLTKIRIDNLRRYGMEQVLAAAYPDSREREDALQKLARSWAEVFDGHSMIVLRRAADYYDAEKNFRRIKAKVLYVLSTTDRLFPPALLARVVTRLRDNGVDVDYFELDSDKGHFAIPVDAARWAPALRAFLARLNPETSKKQELLSRKVL